MNNTAETTAQSQPPILILRQDVREIDTSKGLLQDLPKSTELTLGYAREGVAHIALGISDASIAAYGISLLQENGSWELIELNVNRDFRRQGIASGLTALLIDGASKSGGINFKVSPWSAEGHDFFKNAVIRTRNADSPNPIRENPNEPPGHNFLYCPVTESYFLPLR